MSRKKITFKQRIRRNDLKGRNKMSSGLRKRMGVTRRNFNKTDNVDNGSRPIEEMMEEIGEGTAIPSMELSLDPRSLTDLLLCPTPVPLTSADTTAAKSSTTASHPGAVVRLMLPTAPLPEDDPSALPNVALIEAAELERRRALEEQAAGGSNKNKYRHHGQPYLFWERVGVHPLLLKALRAMRFSHPTPVQEEVLPSVLRSDRDTPEKSKKQRSRASREEKDVIVSAETGSGKTLVFALPILNDVLRRLEQQGMLVAAAAEENEEERAIVPSSSKGRGDTSTHAKARKRSRVTSIMEAKESSPAKKAVIGDDKQPVRCSPNEFIRRVMHTLIVSPTRELALQINDAFKQLIQFVPQVSIGCIVGGMAQEKQQRVLNRHPHILICTPGRLWDLVEKNEGCYLGHSISSRLHYVVLDEADKLLQSGRFEQLKSLLERIHCEVLPAGFVQDREEGAEVGEVEVEAGRWDPVTQTFIPFSADEQQPQKKSSGRSAPVGEEEGEGTTSAKRRDKGKNKKKRMPTQSESLEEADEKNLEDADFSDDDDDEPCTGKPKGRKDQPRPIPMPASPSENHRVTTYVTSATLSLQTNYERRDFKANKKIIRTTSSDVMGKVLQQLEIKPSNAHVFTLSEKASVATHINETYLRCPEKSKDLYCYYFLKTYRNDRTIIFVNAISMLRRLVKIVEILGIPVVGLHASMQQRQRLKFIDKFKSGEIRVLIATDVASRGLDIDGLKYVVHYQVPRTTDAYIHRCGRTARCGGTGLSVLLVNAEEHVSFRKLMESLGRNEKEMEVFALQPSIVHQLHPHLRVALQIDKLQMEIDKGRSKNRWVERMSKGAELELGDMFDKDLDEENQSKLKAIKALKRELELMTNKFTGSMGGKGAFRTGANAIGANQAEEKLRERANRQTLRLKK